MNLPFWVWGVTIVGLVTLIALDLLIIGRRPHEVSVKEAGLWVGFYVTLAVLFGLGILVFSGSQYAGEFFAGYLTEYSLSVDNLFVFVIIMARFAVPAAYQQTVLLIGVVLALILRGVFIAAGAAAVERFQWLFYLFGLFLVFTAVRLMKDEDEQADFQENAALRLVRRVVPTSREYHGTRLLARVNGRRLVTPMFVVIVAIGTTDLLFALDSIPAIFGLTKEPYLVFTANAFALMGLRQLFFLIGGLLDRLVYLSYGLSVILGFIGVKLILEALHLDGVSWAPEIPILVSLGFILVTLAITVVASLLKARRDGSRVPQREVTTPLRAEVPAVAGRPGGRLANGSAGTWLDMDEHSTGNTGSTGNTDEDRPRPGTSRSADPQTAEQLAEAPDIGAEDAPSRTDPANATVDQDTDDGPHDPTKV